MSAADLIRSRMNWDGLFETEEDIGNSGRVRKTFSFANPHRMHGLVHAFFLCVKTFAKKA